MKKYAYSGLAVSGCICTILLCFIVPISVFLYVLDNNTQAPTVNSGVNSNLVAKLHGRDIEPLNGIHYVAGSGGKPVGSAFDGYYYGRDYLDVKGMPLYAPFDADVVYQANIGSNTPQLELISKDGRAKLYIMHLDTKVVGGTVQEGDVVGYVDSLGDLTTQSHTHLSYYIDGKLADVEDGVCSGTLAPVQHDNVHEYGSYVKGVRCSDGNEVYFTMSHYDTRIKDSVNCWKPAGSDDSEYCKYTRSGELVSELTECTVAASDTYRFDEVLWIEGIGLCRVNDTGGMIVSNWIDVLLKD